MSSSSNVPYKLRPNKAVDRELFLALLARLSAELRLEKYKYVGLGGPFLEDFRLIHARIGIRDMDCVEIEEKTHKRQKFNKPIESIQCIHSSLEDFLDESEFESPVVLWLDYTDPKTIQTQMDTFSRQIIELPIRSVVRITLNANPSSLGKPDASKLAVRLPGDQSTGGGETELEWRLERFKERLADYFPAGLSAEDMKHQSYGKALLNALRLSAEKAVLDVKDRKIAWALATHYSDGQAMVTATAIVVNSNDDVVKKMLDEWEYRSSPQEPHVLDLPALSILERLTMESCDDPKDKLGYELPKSDMKQDPFEAFRKYYRVFPYFSRVEM